MTSNHNQKSFGSALFLEAWLCIFRPESSSCNIHSKSRSDYLSCYAACCCHTLSQNPPASWTLSVDLWPAADFQAANCSTAQHLPLHRLIVPASPSSLLCIIGRQLKFYQEMDALLIISPSAGKKCMGFISTIYLLNQRNRCPGVQLNGSNSSISGHCKVFVRGLSRE